MGQGLQVLAPVALGKGITFDNKVMTVSVECPAGSPRQAVGKTGTPGRRTQIPDRKSAFGTGMGSAMPGPVRRPNGPQMWPNQEPGITQVRFGDRLEQLRQVVDLLDGHARSVGRGFTTTGPEAASCCTR
ncbi:hypothetical protein K1Y78_28375 [Streptomyces sp. tea 10]|nr:hypothetical protein [Streptomyces sp. tea 10]